MINSPRILSSENAPPEAILRAMVKEFGHEWLNWQPQPIWDEIRDELEVEVPAVNKDKIMALKLCIKTRVPWEDWHPFTMCVLSYNDVPLDAEIAQEAAPVHLAYGVRVMTALQPEHEYHIDVQSMIAALLMSHGVCWTPPEPLGEVSNEMMEFLVRKRMGSTEPIDVARKNYETYLETGKVPDDDVHTARLVAIDRYLEHRGSLESRFM